MLDDDEGGARLVADVEQHRAQRLRLPLGDARGRLVEQEHRGPVGEGAGEVDDAPGAGGELADELVGVGLQAHQLDEGVDLLCDESLRHLHRR